MCVCYTTQQKKSTTSESAGFRAVAAAMYVVVMSHSPGCSKKVEGSQGSKKKDWCDSNSFNLEKKISEKKLLCNITSGGGLTKWRSWSEMHLCSKLNYHQKIVFYSCCAGQILAKKGDLDHLSSSTLCIYAYCAYRWYLNALYFCQFAIIWWFLSRQSLGEF